MTGNGVTVGDVLGCLRCGACFAPLLLAPGYCLAWVADLAGFRSRGVGERLAWAVALSFATTPIVAVELAKYGSLTAVCWLGAACSAGLLGLAVAAVGARLPAQWRRRGWCWRSRSWSTLARDIGCISA